MSNIDLDEVAVERQRKKPQPSFTWRSKKYLLPKELPFNLFALIDSVENEDDPVVQMRAVDTILDTILDHDSTKSQKAQFLETSPSLDDILALFSALMDQYEEENKS